MVIICIVPTRRPFNKSSLVYYSSVPGKTIPRSPLSSILILESTLSRGKSAVVLNRSIGSNSPSYIYIFDSSSRRLRSRFKGEMYVSSTTYYSFLFLDRYKRRNKYKIFQRFFEDVIERERERKREPGFGKGTSRKGNSVRCLPSAVCRLALQGTKPTAGSLFTVASRKQRSLLLFFERSNSRGSWPRE